MRFCLEVLDIKVVKIGSCSYFVIGVRNSCVELFFVLGKEFFSVKRFLVLRMCKICGRRGMFLDCGIWLLRIWS